MEYGWRKPASTAEKEKRAADRAQAKQRKSRLRTIEITYDPETAHNGGPIDLYEYLFNELDNERIEVQIREVPK